MSFSGTDSVPDLDISNEFKILTEVAQSITSSAPLSKEIYDDFRAGILDREIKLNSSLMVAMYRYIEHVSETEYKSDRVLDYQSFSDSSSHYVTQVVANFVWFLCFETVRLRALCEVIITHRLKEKANELCFHYSKSIETATLAREYMEFVLRMLCSGQLDKEQLGLVFIPLSIVANPGSRAQNLISFLNENYNLNLKSIDQNSVDTLPINQLFSLYNIDSTYWGGLVWAVFHLLAEKLALDSECTEPLTIATTKTNYAYWLEFMLTHTAKFLPCGYCAMHWQNIMNSERTTIQNCSPAEFPKLMVRLHNRVSSIIGQEELPMEQYYNRIRPNLIRHLRLNKDDTT